MGKAYLGIELGSTRIKAVVIDETGSVLASGSFVWENKPLTDTVWTYDLADARKGLAAAYAVCADDYAAKFGSRPTRFDAMGVSAMMHGYLVFDKVMNQLAPFRTWRSTNASRAGEELSAAFGFHVPARWSVSQLYQSVLDGEAHVKDIAFQTTLAGYIHFLLTGRKVLGVDDASGMFPIDPATKDYDAKMVSVFKEKTGIDVTAIFPKPLVAGSEAGVLTDEGAKLLDPSGALEAGIPLCPPEGDGGTGMVATDAVKPGTGNVSVGTSVFAMMVLDRPLKKAYPEIDVVMTPMGDPVAMVHCNNGCGELDKWVELFGGDYAALLTEAVEKGDADCGGITATNWISAEPLAGVEKPFPYLTHTTDAHLTRANIIRAELKAVFATLVKGMEILRAEGVYPTSLVGHGGLFKTPGVAEKILSDMLGIPVSIRVTAGEGGAWGIARLAASFDTVNSVLQKKMHALPNRAMVMLAACLCGGFLFAREYIQEPVQGEVHASTVLPLKDGGYVAAWFGGTKEAHPDVAIWGARRIGGEWEIPRVLAKVNPESPHFNPVLRRADDGRISLYFKVGRNCSDWRTYLVESRDEGRTWSEPCELVAGDVWGGRGPVRNKCIRLKSGRWLAPASREFDPTSRDLRMLWRAFVDRSDDDGRTWVASPVFEMPDPKAGVIQPTLWVASDGRVRAYLRSTTGYVWETESADDGVTWAPARETKLPNNNSGIDLVKASDGCLYLVLNTASGNWAARSVLEVWRSADDGANWKPWRVLEKKEQGEFSYPCIIEPKPGTLAVTYTSNRRRIAFAELKTDSAVRK